MCRSDEMPWKMPGLSAPYLPRKLWSLLHMSCLWCSNMVQIDVQILQVNCPVCG